MSDAAPAAKPSETAGDGPITALLRGGPVWAFTFYTATVAFMTYFCMYAFRKPFSGPSYDNIEGMETIALAGATFGYKEILALSQIVGYTISKFIGSYWVSAVSRSWRPYMMVGLIAFAWFVLLVYALVPPSYRMVVIFFNGLPLGMIWGLAIRYLEGRRVSEILMAGLSCSYIVSSAWVKSAGLALIQWLTHHAGWSEVQAVAWMPFLVGLGFFPLFCLGVYLLNQIPEPSPEDEAERVHRQSMTPKDSYAFFNFFALGLVLQFVFYFFLTAFRDFRDNFMSDLLTSLYAVSEGQDVAEVTRQVKDSLASSELLVGFGVMIALATVFLIRNNRWALTGIFVMMGLGAVVMIGSTLLFDAGVLSGFLWVVLIGLGGYLMYVPNGSIFFDRLLASSHWVGTAAFAIFLIDGVGYCGSITIQSINLFAKPEITTAQEQADYYIGVFRLFSYGMGALGLVLLTINAWYFTHRADQPHPDAGREEP